MEQDILTYALEMDCQALHMKVDRQTDMKAIIAIHSTKFGPALGGCRFLSYPSTTTAAIDAIRLAQGMAYKAAISNLPLGGGKMVLLKPEKEIDRTQYFKAVGRFVESLHGQYITAVDSGTSVEDMDIVATVTSHVTSTSQGKFSNPDPSPLTAHGVLRGIEAAVKFKLNKNTVKDIHVAIQGVGHAGYHLAKELHERGARLTVFDINPLALERVVKEFKANIVSTVEDLIGLDCDVFSPCALGGILNDATIAQLKAPIVAGCANNQLESPSNGMQLFNKNILYAPDYVINAGGLIYVAAQYSHISELEAKQKIDNLYEVLMQIFQDAKQKKLPTNEMVDKMAKEKLAGG